MKKIFFTFLFLIHSVSNAAVLTHSYLFDSDFGDSTGSLVIVGNGGAVSSGRYTFGVNEGLTLTGGLIDTENYSIEISSEFDSIEQLWIKIIDFQNLTADEGLYIKKPNLYFWDATSSGSDSIAANTDYSVVLTRDSVGNTTKGYLNGDIQWSTNSASSVSTDNILNFFIDDIYNNGEEAQSGSVDYIRIYDGALTDVEVGNLEHPTTVPVPAAIWLSVSALVGLLGVARRKQAV